jgi:hypothetical protein
MNSAKVFGLLRIKVGTTNLTSKCFLLGSGAVLTITGLAKIWSALGNSKFLSVADPIIGIKFDHLMIAAGLIELCIALFLLVSKKEMLSVCLVAWMSTAFLAYRFGLLYMGWHRPCSCLGNLTDSLHISPELADNIMKGILAYLLIGSYGILVHTWWNKRKLAVGKLKLGIEKSQMGVDS